LTENQNLNGSKLIQLHLYAGDFDSAWQVYENHLAQSGAESAGSHLEKGRILLAEGRLAEAQLQLEAALDIEPTMAAAHLLLSKIALDQNRLGEAVQHAAAARFLVETPATLYQAALAAAASGDESSALELYEEAFTQLTAPTDRNLSRYATEVARRRPLPVSYLPCLVWIYPTRLLIDISEAEGSLLEQSGQYLEASRVYQRLLGYEPAATTIATKLEALCQNYPEICDFRAK
jgi:tetratricopeptide (TPR) repeat protein